MFDSRVSAVMLSRGGTWEPRPWDLPYLMPPAGSHWPDGATAQCVFYDNAGGTLAAVTGTVAPTGITFSEAPTVMDLIPAGANFEIFLTVDAKPYQIRYGKVLRREAQFTQQPESVRSPLAFADSWPTLGIRSTWINVNGVAIVVGDNSDLSLPNGVASNGGAMRWYKPLSGDTAKVKIVGLNRYTYSASSSTKVRIILSANVSLTSYLAVEFEASSNASAVHTDKIHFCTGSGPTTVTYQGSPITNVYTTADEYTIRYDDTSGTLSVYKNADTTPLGSWTDTLGAVPHGPGYRYLGLGWAPATGFAQSLQVTSWQAIDDI